MEHFGTNGHSLRFDPVEIVKDLERHGTTVVERMRYGGNLQGSPGMPYQRAPSTYPRGMHRVSMVTDDPYVEEPDSEMEDDAELSKYQYSQFGDPAIADR